MKISSLALAMVAGASLDGCATVMNGTNIDYMTQTDPTGADIVFLNGLKCTSPCTLELKRGADTRVDIAKPGYEPVYVLVPSRLAGSTFGNILAGGIIGGGVDGGNGASNTLFPRPLKVRLAPAGSGQKAMLLDKDGMEIFTVDDHNDKVRADVAKTIGADLAGMGNSNANKRLRQCNGKGRCQRWCRPFPLARPDRPPMHVRHRDPGAGKRPVRKLALARFAESGPSLAAHQSRAKIAPEASVLKPDTSTFCSSGNG